MSVIYVAVFCAAMIGSPNLACKMPDDITFTNSAQCEIAAENWNSTKIAQYRGYRMFCRPA